MLLQRCRSVSPPSVFIVTIILIVRWRAAPSLASPSSCKGIARTTRAIITERAQPTDVGAAPAARGTNVETQCFGIFFFFLNCEEFVLGWVYYVCCCFPLWMWWIEFRAVLHAQPLADATLLVEFRLHFTITHLGMKHNQKEPFWKVSDEEEMLHKISLMPPPLNLKKEGFSFELIRARCRKENP